MCELHTSARPLRESLLRSYNSVAATTFSSTSDQFFSNWRSGPNQTPSILHGPSFQVKGPGRTQPFHAPNRKPTDFSRLILAPVTASYLPISLLTSSTSALLVTSTLTSSAYAVYLATWQAPGNVRPRRTGFTFSFCRKGSSARIYIMGDNGQPWRIDRVRVKGSDLTPFTSTMTLGDA